MPSRGYCIWSQASDGAFFLLGSHFFTGSSDARATSGVAAILVADLEHLACEWAVVVVAATACLGVKPDARSTVKRASAFLTRLVIGMQFVDEIGALAFQAIPSRFPHVFKYMIERGTSNDHAACATTFA